VADPLPVLTLLSRGYCRLCQDMLDAVDALRAEFGFVLDVVDVDAAPELEARYGEDVPVLLHRDRELARHRLEPERLRRYLAHGLPEI